MQELLLHAINRPNAKLTPLSGGDVAQSFHCLDETNGECFIKTHPNPPANFFTTEAQGLAWMAQTDTVRVPAVLTVSDEAPTHLMLEWIPLGRQVMDEAGFGRALATMHQKPFAAFGRPDERTTGSLGLPNTPNTDWATFFATCRLTPLCRIASDRRALPKQIIATIENLSERLGDFVPTGISPSLVHGDLWAGNRIADETGNSWVIDPAAHGNHPEFDLAIMRLFGGFSEECFAAYHEASPLETGWQDRISLFQLPHLIVHAIKFGGHYPNATADALARLLK